MRTPGIVFEGLTLGLVFTSTNCSRSEENDGDAKLVEAYLDALNAVQKAPCRWWEEAGWNTEQACVDGVTQYPAYYECYEDFLDAHSNELKDWLICNTSVSTQFGQCLAGLTCSDYYDIYSEAFRQCLDDRDSGFESCPEWPAGFDDLYYEMCGGDGGDEAVSATAGTN